MPTITPKPFVAAAVSGSGFSLGLSEVKAGQFVRLCLTSAACQTLAGCALQSGKDHLAVSLSSDKGKSHLMAVRMVKIDDPAALPLFGSTHGGVFAKITPWCQMPKGKLPARALPVVGNRDGAILLKLPEWARPLVATGGSAPIMEC